MFAESKILIHSYRLLVYMCLSDNRFVMCISDNLLAVCKFDRVFGFRVNVLFL